MAPINLDRLVLPIADDQPSGPSLEGDADYLALEMAATRHPETEIGGLVAPAREPDWAAVQRSALDLLERSKDLQIAVHLVEALIHNHGLAGFRDGLRLVRALVERYWESLHPVLDPGDGDGAASERVMRLKGLGDRARMVRALRRAPILTSSRHGSFSLNDVQAIGRETEDGGDRDVERAAALDDALLRIDAGRLQTTFAEVAACLDHLEAIVDFVDERADVCESLGFEAVVETITDIRGWLEDQLAAKGAEAHALPDLEPSPSGAACDGTPKDGPPTENGSAGAAASSMPAGIGRPASISTRDEALKTIDLLCQYFERHEPSSPVPLILRRAKRLVAKDFMTILKDLVPEGLDQLEKMIGDCCAGEAASD